jgi:hypothetical protein
MKNKKYTVSIGEKTTRLLIDPKKEIEYGDTVEEFDGGNHNYDGIKGYAIERAVEKLFGSSCYWFGNCDMLYHGQVVGSGGSTQTPNVIVDVVEGWE